MCSVQVLSKRLSVVDPDFDQAVDAKRHVQTPAKCEDEKPKLQAEILRLKDKNRHLREMNEALDADLAETKAKIKVTKPDAKSKFSGKSGVSKQEFDDLQANYRFQHFNIETTRFFKFSWFFLNVVFKN